MGGGAPLTRKRHTMPHPAQPRHTNHWGRGNDTSKSTGRSGRQNAAARRNMRRDERVTVQGPVKEPQPDGMSHGGGGGGFVKGKVGHGSKVARTTPALVVT